MNATANRIDWIDYAKGICIILVVMMHSTLGVENALGRTGYLHDFIEWARPFRMPDFFLISGLFLMRRINAPWRSYLDSKVLHFAYFYVLWMTLQFILKGPGIAAEHGVVAALSSYALGFVNPFGTLWFIYLLAIFFVVTKALHKLPPILIFAGAALLEMLPIHTGWLVVDEFAARYVYFFVGYWLAPKIFNWADHIWHRNVVSIIAMLCVWSTGHTLAVFGGVSDVPGLSIVLGFSGCVAVICSAILLNRSGWAEWLRYLGANSIVVYLAFFLFMAATRSFGLKFIPNINVDVLSVLTTTAGLIGPILLFWLVRGTALAFLFKRPSWISLKQVENVAKPTYSASHDSLPKQPQAR